MVIIEDYHKEQQELQKQTDFILNFNNYLNTFEKDKVRLKDLLQFIVDKNKQYKFDNFNGFNLKVKHEEEEYETITSRYNIRHNVVIYIENNELRNKVSIAVVPHPRYDSPFSLGLNEDNSNFDFKFFADNIYKIIEFVFYGIES